MTTLFASQPAESLRVAERSRRASRAAALTPLWAGLILLLAPVRYFDGLFVAPPAAIALPLGVWAISLAVVLGLIGVVSIWNVRSRMSEKVALIMFTAPATLLVVLAPPAIEFLKSAN
jgi:hypothetical protein